MIIPSVLSSFQYQQRTKSVLPQKVSCCLIKVSFIVLLKAIGALVLVASVLGVAALYVNDKTLYMISKI